MKNKNLVICGFMGCGKTATGKIIAKKLKRKFADIDELIEKEAGMDITQIYERFGEDYFRKLERDTVTRLSGCESMVISAGGGTVINGDNAQMLKYNGIIVFIDTPLDILIKRLMHDRKRPILQTEDRESTIRSLYEKRLPVYKSVASVIVDGSLPAHDTAISIITLLNLKKVKKKDE